MKILVDRFLSDDEATLSRVILFDARGREVFRCYGLEDEFREIKVPGETRIPAGKYSVYLRTEGGFHNRYSQDRRFRDTHRGMLWIKDVPGFEYILIHVGNYESDTAGCLLVGMEANKNLMCVTNSVRAYRALYANCAEAAEKGALSIEFRDNDRQ